MLSWFPPPEPLKPNAMACCCKIGICQKVGLTLYKKSEGGWTIRKPSQPSKNPELSRRQNNGTSNTGGLSSLLSLRCCTVTCSYSDGLPSHAGLPQCSTQTISVHYSVSLHWILMGAGVLDEDVVGFPRLQHCSTCIFSSFFSGHRL